MEIRQVINLIANLILGMSMTMIYLYLFTDMTKAIHKWTYINHWLLKSGLIFIICSTALLCYEADDPSPEQFVHNIGMALLFIWVWLFHRNIFKSAKQKKKK